MINKKEFNNTEGLDKLESLLRIKPDIKAPEFNEDLYFSSINSKNNNNKKLTFYSYSYLKAAAIYILVFIVILLYIKFDLLNKIESHKLLNITKLEENRNTPVIIGIIVFVKGSVEIKDEKNETLSTAYIGNTINDNSTIITKDNSYIELFIEKKIQLRINENTTIKIKKNDKVWKILQDQGESFHNIKSLMKGEEYLVETPTTIAGVRGTFFKVKNNKDFHEIEVERGKVNVYIKEMNANTNQIKVVDILNNKKIFIYDEKKQIFEKKDTKKSNLSVILDDMNEHIKIIENEALWEEIKKIPNVVNKNDIEKVYNKRLEIISLKDGRKLQGVIAAQVEEKIILHTTEGIILINISDINEITYTDN